MSLFKRKHLNGVHTPHFKQNTQDCTPVRMPVPEKVYISMQQHMGAPAKPVVEKGDVVKVGQLIGAAEAFMCSPVYASVSGKVVDMSEIVNVNSSRSSCIVIESDGLQTVHEAIAPPVLTDHKSFVQAVRDSGLVGLGGAGFPTAIKLNPKNVDEVDTLVINGAECEPYITTDYRTMLDLTDDVLAGILLVQKYLSIETVRIGIEKNKPKAIEVLGEKVNGRLGISVVPLPDRYPKGAEKVVIYETTGRVVPEGKLPSDVGVVVMNVTSVAFLARYMRTGMPLVEKNITVDGSAINKPQNVTAPIGTSYADLVAFCGGYKNEPKVLIAGGPMMGTTVYSDSYPVVKTNNAVLAFDESPDVLMPETPCIRCGRCIQNCPYNLMPAAFESAYKARDVETLRKLKVNLCMECGCCSFICPTRRHLVQNHRLAKKLLLSQPKKTGGK